MIQLNILSGNKAGGSWAARRFPVRIGRSASADLRLEDPGVWERHLQLDFKRREGFLLSVQPEALATVNGQPVSQTRLRNGDVIEIGALKLQFWLAQTSQTGLGFREWLTWLAIAAICLIQVALIYWLQA